MQEAKTQTHHVLHKGKKVVVVEVGSASVSAFRVVQTTKQ